MSINLDMDIGDLMQMIFSKKEKAAKAPVEEKKPSASFMADNPHKQPILIAVAIALLFGAFMMGVYSPYRSSIDSKGNLLVEVENKNSQLSNLDAQASALENDIAMSKDHYVDVLGYFGDNNDLGMIYEAISTLALESELVVVNVKESGRVHKKEKMHGTVVRADEVEVELHGGYSDYMKFRNALANKKSLLTIHAENIKVLASKEDAGKVSAKLKLLAYTIDKEPFNKIISSIKEQNTQVAKNE